MKTFGLFLILWVSYILITFNILRGVTVEQMLKLLLATQMAYIMYRLCKEEIKD